MNEQTARYLKLLKDQIRLEKKNAYSIKTRFKSIYFLLKRNRAAFFGRINSKNWPKISQKVDFFSGKLRLKLILYIKPGVFWCSTKEIRKSERSFKIVF